MTTTHERMPQFDRPRARSVNATCAALGVGRSTIYDMARRGKIRLVKIASRTLVPEKELDRLLGEVRDAE
jgi:excisionase family DNA binding protein